ncbi:hypothetical protein B5S33_g1296 [[Candida] boidinii]|nr:hypothetical protein B5S30_g1688 [[Candida] boidinii]OWB82668.1 hypothetical protein B5S33_g1296 [[Candida] boidinii]GMF99649.1 unnamed protein product [[Candida] boidinii]
MSGGDSKTPTVQQSFGRRTWDEKEYAKKAFERRQKRLEDKNTENIKDGNVKINDYYKNRKSQIQKIENQNKISLVSSFYSKNAGFYCETCNRKFQDNLKYVDHLNSPEHLEKLGFSKEDFKIQKHFTLDEIKERLEFLKNEKLKSASENVKWIDLNERIKLRKLVEEKEREKRKLKRQRKKQKLENYQSDDADSGVASFFNDNAEQGESSTKVMEIMGFSKFGS